MTSAAPLMWRQTPRSGCCGGIPRLPWGRGWRRWGNLCSARRVSCWPRNWHQLKQRLNIGWQALTQLLLMSIFNDICSFIRRYKLFWKSDLRIDSTSSLSHIYKSTCNLLTKFDVFHDWLLSADLLCHRVSLSVLKTFLSESSWSWKSLFMSADRWKHVDSGQELPGLRDKPVFSVITPLAACEQKRWDDDDVNILLTISFYSSLDILNNT